MFGKCFKIHQTPLKGFTLAELLIALAILGVIATFTIPKVLQAQQDQSWNAIAKEAAATISGAYQAYRFNNTLSSSTKPSDLTPYMNYVSVETLATTSVDMEYWGASPQDCNGGSVRSCLRLHNGAILQYEKPASFGDTNATNAFWFRLDPDGKVTEAGSPAYGNGKAVVFFLYYDGRLVSYEDCLSGTVANGSTLAAPTCPHGHPGPDPPWFHWN